MRRVIEPNSFYNHIAALHSSLLRHTRYLPEWVTEEGTLYSPIPCREWNTEICYIYQPHNWRHFRDARDYWGCHGNSTLWRCVRGGASCKTAWNLRPRQAPFTTQTPPLAGVRGPQNQPSEQYRRAKLTFGMAKRVKTLLGVFHRQTWWVSVSLLQPNQEFLGDCLHSCVFYAYHLKNVLQSWGWRKNNKKAPQEHIYTSDSVRRTGMLWTAKMLQ